MNISSRYIPLNVKEARDIQSRRQGRDTNYKAETISPANWKDYDVIVEHHADYEDAEAEQLERIEVLPAHADAGKDKVVVSSRALRSHLTIQITRVLMLSSTILVVADNSLVTLIPAKLKKAMEMMVPEKARASKGLWASW